MTPAELRRHRQRYMRLRGEARAATVARRWADAAKLFREAAELAEFPRDREFCLKEAAASDDAVARRGAVG